MRKEASNYLYYFNSLKKSPHFANVEDTILHEILEMFHNKKYMRDNFPFYF